MIDALIQGKLIKAPESRTTKAGKPMASARLRVATADPAASVLCGVVAFEPEAVAALLALGEGDAVSVAGPLVGVPQMWGMVPTSPLTRHGKRARLNRPPMPSLVPTTSIFEALH